MHQASMRRTPQMPDAASTCVHARSQDCMLACCRSGRCTGTGMASSSRRAPALHTKAGCCVSLFLKPPEREVLQDTLHALAI